MKVKNITLKTNKDKIVNEFIESFKGGDSVNLKTKNGYIYTVGGILAKLEGKDMYIAISDDDKKTKWVKIKE